LRECKARGEEVFDSSRLLPGETEDDWHRVFDQLADAEIECIRKLLDLYEVPVDVIDVVVGTIRKTFQAQIVHLRRSAKVARAFELFWSDTRSLAHEPDLLRLFREALEKSDPALAATAMADIRRRYQQSKAILKCVK
jgi:hypothetical protein